MKPLARQTIAALQGNRQQNGELTRNIGLFALICFGVGSTVGAGIFVLTGTVAAQHAGPAVALSFLIASAVCLLAGLCYAELAAMMPVAGSAYSYSHASMGVAAAWCDGRSLYTARIPALVKDASGVDDDGLAGHGLGAAHGDHHVGAVVLVGWLLQERA